MKKILLTSVMGLCLLTSLNALSAPTQQHHNTILKPYQNFKKELYQRTGLTYNVDISALMQRAAPNGKGTSWQTIYYGDMNWDIFQSDRWGNGSVQIAYNAVRYWGKNASYIGNNIGIISDINDYSSPSNEFDQLSYTHQFPGLAKGLSVTIGQFPMYNFDGGPYLSNQQTNFINYSLSQNASSAYPTASLGAYATFSPTDNWSFSIGMQDAHNISGETISTHKFSKGNYTSFISLSYTPTDNEGNQNQYSLLLYNQPSVPSQPNTSNGWSLNMTHYLNKKWAVTGRVNGTTNSPEAIKQSYALGIICNNPFNRNESDQFGFAGAVNKLNKSINGANTRSVENVLETYYAFGISDLLTITPDIQLYINPGANTKSNTAVVTSVRATLSL